LGNKKHTRFYQVILHCFLLMAAVLEFGCGIGRNSFLKAVS
jgi:hypothetical protein